MKGWRTILVGAVVTMLGMLTVTDFIPWVGETWSGVAFAMVGVAMMALRVVTNTPVGEK